MIVPAVTGIAPESGDDVATVEGEARQLQLGKLVGPGQRNCLVKKDRTGGEVEAHQIVLGRRAHPLVADDEHLAACRVDDGRTCDPHVRRDVAAGKVLRGHGVADVGRPGHCARVGVQSVDSVVFCGDHDDARLDEWLAEDVSVDGV